MLQDQQDASINIKPDPRVTQYQQFRWIYVLNPIWLLLVVFMQFTSHGFNVAALPLRDKIYCVFALILAVLMFVLLPYQRRWFQRLELRRQAAARGDTKLLADLQPVPDAHAVQLPFTVNAVPRTPTRPIVIVSIVFALTIGLVAGAIGFLIALSRAGHTSVVHISTLLLVAIIVFAVVISVALMVVMRHYMYNQKIIFSEHGLMQLGPSSQVHSIPWRDARLFARNAPYGIVKIKSEALPSTFQIAGENEVVQWHWIHSKRYKPPFGLSPAEYNQQMQGLLSVITARTGLPLYDLRKQSSAE